MESTKIRVLEIFDSIQGEGVYTGYPTTFIRLAGCNLKCKYCDTKESWDKQGGKEWDLEELKEELMGYPLGHHFCITGGEPFLQRVAVIELTQWLIKSYYKVNIETNGTFRVTEEGGLPDDAILTMDLKCPSSGMYQETMISNICCLGSQDEVKFVVGTGEDLELVQEILRDHHISATKIISPVIGEGFDKDILDQIIFKLKHFKEFDDVKLGYQIHKLIGVK